MRLFTKLAIPIDVARDASVCLLVIVFSMGVGHFYTEGDQMHYIAAYEAMADSDLFNGFWIYKSHITTEEPVHFFISWIFSSVIGANKLFVMSLSNGLLAFLLIRVVKKIGGATSVAYVFVLSNYYFIVVYLTAERLKFSFIFLLLALLALERPKAPYLLFLFSVLSHMQMLILLVAREFQRLALAIVRMFQRLSFSKSLISYLIALVFAMFVFFHFFGEYLLWKVPQYMGAVGLSSVWQTALFMLMTLAYVSDRMQVILFFIPIVVASLVVGPERVVIIAYFVFVYYAVQYRRGLNYGIGLSALYFGLKSIGFLANIFSTGQGFSDGLAE